MGPKILTVDDSKSIRMMVARAFRSFACEILEAGDGVEGLAVAKRELPDLIILDYTMPIMDGVEMLTHLKSDPQLKAIPIVMLTAESGCEKMLRIAKLGVRDYLIKPFKEEMIIERVGRVIDLKARAETATPTKLLERCVGLAVLAAACSSTLLAGSAPGYLAWVEPVPLRFAQARTPGPLPAMLAERPPPPVAAAASPVPSDTVTESPRPEVSGSPLPAEPSTRPEEPGAPAVSPQEFIAGPEAMLFSAVSTSRPVLLVTPQTLVELMRMHGTNASMTTPSNFESPMFLPPMAPASRATYNSAPPPKP